jgi:hypothetical protein
MRGLSFYKRALLPTDIQTLVSGTPVSGSLSYVERSARVVTLQSIEISGCTAVIRDGGGLLAHSGVALTMQNMLIANNTAQKGGGVCVLGSIEGLTPVVIKDSVISGNTAEEGAGIFFEDGTLDPLVRARTLQHKLSVSSTDFTQNIASVAGGGLKLSQLQDDWSVHTHTGQELLNVENVFDPSLDPDVQSDHQMGWFGRWTLSPDSNYVYAT